MVIRKLGSALLVASLAAGAAHADDIKKGDKLQTLTNLHPDNEKHLLYTANYQQPGLIPVCEEVTVTDVGRGDMKFDYQGTSYKVEYEKHTKGAGVSFQDALKTFFGPSCDKAKIKSLSKADQEGIKSGKPQTGMSKDGVMFAMGRPPSFSTASLDSNTWLYWRNRFGKTEVTFDDKGKVSGIR